MAGKGLEMFPQQEEEGGPSYKECLLNAWGVCSEEDVEALLSIGTMMDAVDITRRLACRSVVFECESQLNTKNIGT